MAHSPRFTRNPMYVNAVQELARTIVDQVLSYETKRLATVLQQLVTENQTLGGTMNAFVYGGRVFSLVDSRFLRGIQVKPVHKGLETQVEHYSKLLDKLDTDRRRILNSLSVVTLKCKTSQDVRDALPEIIVALVPSLKSMDRFNDEGFLLRKNPVLLKQYHDAMDLLLDYQAKRLIY